MSWGWPALYRLSWRLGWRALLRGGPVRQALVRIVIPLDPSRYMELPDTLAQLSVEPGEQVLDLASPKLAAVALSEDGAKVTSVDALESEVEAWRRLAGERDVRFMCADGRALPFEDATFDHAYSISVIEHIEGQGDEAALRELARVVRPGGRVVVTLPFAERYHEDWRDRPVYDDEGATAAGERYFFERHYDQARLEQLSRAAGPELRESGRRVMRLVPNWHRLYVRAFPWLVALGPFYGLLGRVREGPPGDVVRVTFVREAGR